MQDEIYTSSESLPRPVATEKHASEELPRRSPPADGARVRNDSMTPDYRPDDVSLRLSDLRRASVTPVQASSTGAAPRQDLDINIVIQLLNEVKKIASPDDLYALRESPARDSDLFCDLID